jgi:hypothetical protein
MPAHVLYTEPVFLNVYGALELIPRNEFRHPIPTQCLAPIDCIKIPALYTGYIRDLCIFICLIRGIIQ